MNRRVVHAIRGGRLRWVVQRRRWWSLTWRDEPGRTYGSQTDAVAAMLAARPSGIRPAFGRSDRAAPFGG
jgi:hypothetical protein